MSDPEIEELLELLRKAEALAIGLASRQEGAPRAALRSVAWGVAGLSAVAAAQRTTSGVQPSTVLPSG